MPTAVSKPAGLYIHVPFCVKKCPYCDFFSVTDPAGIPPFIDALTGEMRLKSGSGVTYDTLYIGGGTPSILKAEQIRRLIEAARESLQISEPAEITLEVNPGTVDARALKTLIGAGVNRLNIGVQSFEDEHLVLLGRIHTAEQGRQAVAAAQAAGFSDIGVDLIFGLPGQSPQSWRKELEQALSLQPAHISCYQLTVEPGTPMADDLGRGLFKPLPEAAVAELFELTQSLLAPGGYLQYEVSNFARSPARISKHNRKYWTMSPYDGMGPSAHSFRPALRWWNHRHVGKYCRDVQNGKAPVAGKEVLNREQRCIEAIYLGLRTAEGIDTRRFDRDFAADFNTTFSEPIAVLTAEGLLSRSSGNCSLTAKGMRFHESIAKMFIQYL